MIRHNGASPELCRKRSKRGKGIRLGLMWALWDGSGAVGWTKRMAQLQERGMATRMRVYRSGGACLKRAQEQSSGRAVRGVWAAHNLAAAATQAG